MSKMINVSFNPNECWHRQDFRDFIDKLKQTENIKLYIISVTGSDTSLISYNNSVSDILNIATTRVFNELNNADFLTEIEDNNIDIHFDTDNDLLTDIQSSVLTCNTILVRYATNYTPDPTFINDFARILKDLVNA